jgi:hypothetical protein
VEIIYERVAAVDVGKKVIAVAVRTPGERPRKRRQQVRKYNTYYQTLARDGGLAGRRGRHAREHGSHGGVLAPGLSCPV